MLYKVCMEKKSWSCQGSLFTDFENNKSTYLCVFVLQKFVACDMLVTSLSLKYLWE